MVDRSRTAVALPYHETVQGSALLTGVVVLAAVVAALAGVAAATDTSLAPGERVVVGLLMLLLAGVLVFVGAVFRWLRVEVNAIRVFWSFSPFGRSVLLAQVAAVRVEPYCWLRFGGWGTRHGILSCGGGAYTVPFSLRCVAWRSSSAIGSATT